MRLQEWNTSTRDTVLSPAPLIRWRLQISLIPRSSIKTTNSTLLSGYHVITLRNSVLIGRQGSPLNFLLLFPDIVWNGKWAIVTLPWEITISRDRGDYTKNRRLWYQAECQRTGCIAQQTYYKHRSHILRHVAFPMKVTEAYFTDVRLVVYEHENGIINN